MDLSNKKSKNLTYWINLTLYIVFGVLILVIGLYEGLCLNASVNSDPIVETIADLTEGSEDLVGDVSTTTSLVADRFYINNLVIILCPLLDSIIGISFSAYKDKIYGFTISDLKDMSTYSGFTFVEIITISIISIVLCLVSYYFNLFYTTIAINSIVLIYSLIFNFCDISLISRAKWRIKGIFKHTYNSNKKMANTEYLNNISYISLLPFNSIVSSNALDFEKQYEASDLVKKSIDVFCNKTFESEDIYLTRFKEQLNKNKDVFVDVSYDKLNTVFLNFIQNVINRTFADKNQVLVFSDDKLSSLYIIYLHFLHTIYDVFYDDCPNDNTPKFELIADSFSASFSENTYPEIYYLNLKSRLIIANLVIKDGLVDTMKCLDMSTGLDVEACLSCQKLFLGDVISCDTEYISLYLSQSYENILSLIEPCKGFPSFLTLITNSPYSIASSLSSAIVNLKITADKYQDDNEKTIDFMNLLEKCLPVSEHRLRNLPLSLQKYYFALGGFLLVDCLKNDSFWVYDYLNKLFYEASNFYMLYDFGFYIFSSIYLEYKYNSGELSNATMSSIDSYIKVDFGRNLKSLFYKSLYASKYDGMIGLLIDMLNILNEKCTFVSFSKPLHDYSKTNRTCQLDNSYIFRWWFSLICSLDYRFSPEDFASLKSQLQSLKYSPSAYVYSYDYWDAFKREFSHFYSNATSFDIVDSYFSFYELGFDETKFKKRLILLNDIISSLD